MEIEVFTDGGSRGNPGPSAGAYIVFSNGGEIARGGEYFGTGTNNTAEYRALALAVRSLATRVNLKDFSKIAFYLDSELVVKQLTGIYKIKNAHLKTIADAVMADLEKLGVDTAFYAIPREKNKLADLLVNKILDENS